jgi:hypothetical protein
MCYENLNDWQFQTNEMKNNKNTTLSEQFQDVISVYMTYDCCFI